MPHRTTPADSIATSLPAPIALPASARARAEGIVDAVADHGDLEFSGLEFGDFIVLVGREDSGEHLIDVEFFGDVAGELLSVTGDDVHKNAHIGDSGYGEDTYPQLNVVWIRNCGPANTECSPPTSAAFSCPG